MIDLSRLRLVTEHCEDFIALQAPRSGLRLLFDWAAVSDEMTMQERTDVLSKVPEVTLGFWIIKILATTLGETGGDTVTMSWLHADENANNGGYLIGTALFLAVFVGAVVAQISTRRFNKWVYWLAIVASTTVGTAMADFFDRSLGIGYAGGSSVLLACVLASLAIWYFALGSVDVQTVASPKAEVFYWVTITFSQTLGTALGDWTADSTGLGYDGGAILFGAGLLILAALYFWTNISRVFLFWAAFILTRPLGATVGDFLDKPTSHGGLALSRPLASAVMLVAIVLLVLILPQRAGRHPSSRVLTEAT
ncbi:putative membrane-anchored protein [Bradyrhizobium sp. USDA 4472]